MKHWNAQNILHLSFLPTPFWNYLTGQDEPLNNNCLRPNDLILTATSYMICFCLPLKKGRGLASSVAAHPLPTPSSPAPHLPPPYRLPHPQPSCIAKNVTGGTMAITVSTYMAQKQLPASMGTASALSKTMIIILVCVRYHLLFLFIVKFSMWTASAKNGFVQYNRFQNLLR